MNEIISIEMLTTLLVTLFITGGLFFLIFNSRKKRKKREANLQRYRRIIRKQNLTIREIDLVDSMSVYLHDPSKKYLILTNRGTFKHSLEKLRASSDPDTGTLNSLLGKIGFSAISQIEEDHSTRRLHEGMAVKVASQTGKILNAEIYAVTPDELVVRIQQKNHQIESGDSIELFTCFFPGIALYRMQVENANDSLIYMNHTIESEILSKRVRLNVLVKSEDELENQGRLSEIQLLSQNTAVLLNPQASLHSGEDIRIFFSNDTGLKSHANAEIIKTSGKGRFISVRFKHIKN